MRLKKLSLLLALTLLVSVSALPVTAHAGGSKDTANADCFHGGRCPENRKQ